MFIVIVIPFVLVTLLIIEWKVRAMWLRSLVVFIVVGVVAVSSVILGQHMGQALVKNTYSRHMATIMAMLHHSNSRNEQAVVSAQIDYLYKRLPHAIFDEAELVALANGVTQISASGAAGSGLDGVSPKSTKVKP